MLTKSECRRLLNTQPSRNLGPFALLNLGFRAGLERAAKECDDGKIAVEIWNERQNITVTEACAAAIRKLMEDA